MRYYVLCSLLLSSTAFSKSYQLSRTTPVLKEPTSFQDTVCKTAFKGQSIRLLDDERNNQMFQKIKVLDGKCKNIVGFISTESIEFK